MLSNILLSSLSSPFLAMAAVGKTLQWLYNSNFSVQLLNPYQICTEKAMATHSSTLAWRITGTEELGGLPPLGSHRVGHD